MLKSAVGLFIVAVLVVIIYLPSYTKMQDLRSRNAHYKQQIEYLKKEQMDLLEEGRRLKDDPEYVERVARERMGLIRKGETVYKMVPEE